MRPVLLLVALAACRGDGCAPRGDTGPHTGDTGPADTPADPREHAAGVVRVGPPAPSVGIYGIAAVAGRVYVSNLHVPFLTVLDADTGDLLDAVDLRDGCGPYAFFPRLYVTGEVLWVTHEEAGRLCRYDTAAGRWLDPVEVARFGGLAVDGPDLWIATPDALVRHDGSGFAETVPAPAWASAVDVEDGVFAALVGPEGRLLVMERDGTARWDATLDGAGLNDVALLGGRAYVTDRVSGDVIAVEDGAEVGRVTTGSDTFAVDRLGEHLLVTNRQGAALPPSGAYQGDPALVTALDADLSVAWRTPLSKTVHFVAYDGARLWTANEDALVVSALDPTTGEEIFRSAPVGLTIDHLSASDGAWFFGSHLTDEVWRVALDGDSSTAEAPTAEAPTAEATRAEVCGWPFVAVPTDAGLVVPCQEDGEVWTLDPDTLAVLARADAADTLFPACPDGLCTGHDSLIAAATDGEHVVFSDPHTGGLRWTDGAHVDLGDFPDRGALRHFDVAVLDGATSTVLAFEPRSETVYAVRGGAVVATLPVAENTASFPLVPDGESGRVWVGASARDADLGEVARLPEGHVAHAAGEGWVVAMDGEDLVVFDASLAEVARLDVADLRVPPLRGIGGAYGPLRFLVDAGELIVANTMRGTIERRALPDLAPRGPDEPVPVGHWADLPGIR